MKKFLQYELWKDCNFGCKFCYNLGQKNYFSIESRLKDIIKAIDKFNSKEFSQFGITGGEFFDKQLDKLQIKNIFYILIDKICNKIKSGEIERFLVTTSFMYNKTDDIKEFVEFLKKQDCLKNTLFCTSYDTLYRFNKKTLKNWKNNTKYLYKKYKDFRLHTEIIITDDFITKVLNKKFNLNKFIKKYNTAVDFIQPSVPFGLDVTKSEFEKRVPGFFPKRENFLKLIELWQNQNYDLSRFLCIEDHSDEIHGVINGKPKTISDRSKVEKYISPYRKPNQVGYIDSDKFMRQDVELLIGI